MADKVYKSANALLENEYKDLSDEAIDLFGKGQRLEPAKQQRYDQVKQEMAEAAKQGFTPTKETIWDDPKHPLYGIAPSEQNEDFLSSAIDELTRKTQTPAHWRFYGGPQGGGTRLDAIKKLNQYKKAREYIKNGGK